MVIESFISYSQRVCHAPQLSQDWEKYSVRFPVWGRKCFPPIWYPALAPGAPVAAVATPLGTIVIAVAFPHPSLSPGSPSADPFMLLGASCALSWQVDAQTKVCFAACLIPPNVPGLAGGQQGWSPVCDCRSNLSSMGCLCPLRYRPGSGRQ